MGLDLGSKTIGVALSDPMFITAQPYETIKSTKVKEDIDKLDRIIKEKEVSKLVVGLPKNMDNSYGPQAMRAMSFVDLIKKSIDIEVVYQDERLTSIESESVLMDMSVRRENRKKHIDKIAASFILQGYLDRRSNG